MFKSLDSCSFSVSFIYSNSTYLEKLRLFELNSKRFKFYRDFLNRLIFVILINISYRCYKHFEYFTH